MGIVQHSPIILASGSPRRQALLSDLGIDYTVLLHEIDESFPENLKSRDVAVFLARKKAAAYSQEIESGNTVITADTIVCIDNRILNKPAGREEAFDMLKQLSGKSHEVITAVCITNRVISRCFHVCTSVIFKKLSDAEINYYIEKQRPFDKAGAYGIQEWIGLTGIDRIDGSYYNVVGLPVKELYTHLLDLKILTWE